MELDRYTSFPLSLRPSQYQRIAAAARKIGKRYSQFIREAALERAEQIESQPQDKTAETETNEQQ